MSNPKVKVIIEYMNQGLDNVQSGASSINNLGSTVSDSQQAMANLSNAVTTMSNGMNTFGNDSIKAFADFDQAMANVSSIVKGSKDEISAMRDVASQIGRDMPVSAQAAAEGMYQLASAGKSATDIMAISEGVMRTSIATASDFATTAKIVTAAQDIWKYSNEELNDVQDILLNTVKGFKTTLPELGISMSYVGKSAEALGIDMATTSSLIGMVRQEGIEASSAGTGLRMVFQKMADSATAESGALKVVGDSLRYTSEGNLDVQATMQSLRPHLDSMTSKTERLSFLQEAFGSRAGAVSMILLDQADKIDTTAESMRVKGAVDSAYEIQAEGATNKIQVMNSMMEEQQRIMGEQLLPVQLKIIEAKVKMYEILNKLPGGLGEYSIGIGMVASEMLPMAANIAMVTMAMKGLNLATIKATASTIAHKTIQIAATVATWAYQVAQWALNVAMTANPIGLVVVAIGLLIAAIVFVIVKYDELSGWLKVVALLWLAGLGPIGAVIAIIMVLVKHFDLVKAYIYAVGDAYKFVFVTIFEAVKSVIEKDIEVFRTVIEKITEVLEFLKGLPDQAIQAGKDFIGGFVDGVMEKLGPAKDTIEKGVGMISGLFGGSPPEFGPLKLAMDKGGPAFMEGYMSNLVDAIPNMGGQSSVTNQNFNFEFNNDFGGQDQSLDESMLIDQIRKSMMMLGRDMRR